MDVNAKVKIQNNVCAKKTIFCYNNGKYVRSTIDN